MVFGRKRDEAIPEKPLATYSVIYLGGHPDLPKRKSGEIKLHVWTDHFELLSTVASKSYWKDLNIPYSTVRDVSIVERQEGTAEALLRDSKSQPLNQKNNIHIEYQTERNLHAILRFEMMTGVTVHGQARKCRELQDQIHSHGITDQFNQITTPEQVTTNPVVDIPEQIKKLAVLQKQGILTEEEFVAKKTELLTQM